MKMRFLYLLAGAVLSAILVFGAMSLRAQSTAATQWEYMTIDWLGGTGNNALLLPNDPYTYFDVGTLLINDKPGEPGPQQDLYTVLNQYGADGWELVAVEQRSHQVDPKNTNELTRYILKRAVH